MTNLAIEQPSKEKLGRINAIDLLQGIAVAIMVANHVLLWWNRDGFLGQIDLFFYISCYLASTAVPTFLLLMGFNMRNSIARRLQKVSYPKIRKHLLKRGLLFLLMGFMNDSIMAIASLFTNPEAVIPWLISWELLHIYGSTVFGIYLIYEVFYQLKSRNIIKGDINPPIIITCSISLVLIPIITVFLQAVFSGVYSLTVLDPTQTVDIIVFGEVANLSETVQMALARGSFPLFPFLCFGILGFLLASLRLYLPTEMGWRKVTTVLAAAFTLIGGFFAIFLKVPVVLALTNYKMPSLSYVFLIWGYVLFSLLAGLTIFDVKREKDLLPYAKPVIRLSSLTLTFYYAQNLPFFLDNTLISDRFILSILIILYIGLFMVIAYFWEKKKFKYSLEWILRKLTN
ncbi:MAG: acyltransferase family protein [Candidatus Hodarchaeota archaeon]